LEERAEDLRSAQGGAGRRESRGIEVLDKYLKGEDSVGEVKHTRPRGWREAMGRRSLQVLEEGLGRN
jgi:hypothetical protein